jgi:protein SCO1/2
MRAVPELPPKARWAALVIALAVACGLSLSHLRPAPVDASVLEWLAQPRPVADFTLTSGTGEFTAMSLRGHWQLLVLGFTHCPDLCPLTLAQLAELQAAYPDDTLRIIFISVDPLRDAPQQLADYVHFFGKDFIGVTGAATELHRLAQSLGMDFRRDGPAYRPAISHSPTIALIGPDGFLRGRLRPGFDTQQAARELVARIRAAW